MEKGKFEDSVRDAFKEAQVSPSEESWTNIALQMEQANGSRLKSKVVVYQLMAAASLIFAMGITLGMYLTAGKNDELARQLALQQEINSSQTQTLLESKARIDALNAAREDVDQKSNEIPDSQHETFLRDNSKTENLRIAAFEKKSDRSNEVGDVEQNASAGRPTSNDILLARYKHNDLPPIFRTWQPQIVTKKSADHSDPVALMLARLDDREKEIREKSEKQQQKPRTEKLWTSLGLAAGSFNSSQASGVSNTQSNGAIAMNNTVAEKEASANGFAYSIGVSLGAKVSDRWVIQGGVNYLTQSSDYTVQSAVTSADFATFRPATLNELAKIDVSKDAGSSEPKVVSTAPYDVNNSLRYLSIPLQAGYLLVNKAFGLQLNAGLATDLFLQNTVSAEDGNLATTTQESGEDSPYRSVNFSGLMGTELSYRFAKHYRVALNPGIRYPLNTIYKSEIGVNATPITFDIGLRFRYIFN